MRLKKNSLLLLLLVTASTICVAGLTFFQDRRINVSAVESLGDIGVYSDENCGTSVDSIDWGVIYIGETRKIRVYVRNEGNENLFLAIRPANWNPENASKYLDFSWGCDDKEVEAGRVTRVTLTLRVLRLARGNSSFSFDIIFTRGRSPDVDGDGDVDLYDLTIVGTAWDSSPSDYNWDADADLDCDLHVFLYDLTIIGSYWD